VKTAQDLVQIPNELIIDANLASINLTAGGTYALR
jgi:hypothetical protein